MICKNKRRSTTVPEEISLELYHHMARLTWLIQEYQCLVKKVIRTNTENLVEVGLFVTSLIHFVLFIQIQKNNFIISFFTLINFIYIIMCVYIHHMYTFCLKLNKANNVI